MADTNLSEMIKSSLEGIGYIADSNTVIGDPIETVGGTVIIPVSRLSMGFASGGLDYHPKSVQKGKDTEQSGPSKNASPCFGGGGGTGISVTPVCFLIVDKDGKVSLLNIANPGDNNSIVGAIDSVSAFVDKTPDLITRIKKALSKDEKPFDGMDDEKTSEAVGDIK